jgi:hypothetical protein
MLFPERPRSDARRRQPRENSFRFLDRVDDVYFGRVRRLLNDWFTHLPAEQQRQFKARYASAGTHPVDPVFFELYLHEVLRRLGLPVDYEPALTTTSNRPDFRVTSSNPFFLEVRTVGPPTTRLRSDARRQEAMEPLRNLRSDEFTIELGILRESEAAPPVRRVIPRVEAWLASLDRAEIERLGRRDLSLVPTLTVTAGDWEFRIRPIPKSEARIGKTSPAGSVSMFPGRSSWGGDWGRIRKALGHKAGRYGKLEKPYVIALAVGDQFVDEEEIVNALWGDPGYSVDAVGNVTVGRTGGLWSGGANSRVSAVLTVRHLSPNAVNQVVPILWRNENASHPFTVELPLAADGLFAQTTGAIEIKNGLVTPAEFFDLPPEWPGPERALRVPESSFGSSVANTTGDSLRRAGE